MGVNQFESQNRRKRDKSTAIMDKELDDSLHDITELLMMNTRLNFVISKQYCTSPEQEEELAGIQVFLDSLLAKWKFQQELK